MVKVDNNGAPATQRQQGQEEVAAGASEAAHGVKKMAQSGVESAKNSAKQVGASSKSLWHQVGEAYNVGASSELKTYSRHTNTPRTTGDAIRAPFKATLTAPSFMLGHAVHNPRNGEIEGKFSIKNAATGFVSAAAAWAGSLVLAGISPSKLGFLVNPIPYLGHLSVVNIAAYGMLAFGAAIAVLIAIRVGTALVAKYNESRHPDHKPATTTETSANTASNTTESSKSADKQAAEVEDEAKKAEHDSKLNAGASTNATQHNVKATEANAESESHNKAA